MNLGIVVVLTIMILFLIIGLMLLLVYSQKCGNRINKIDDITKCSNIHLQVTKKDDTDKIYAKNGNEVGKGKKNRLTTILKYNYRGYSYKNVFLVIKLYHENIGRKGENYVLTQNRTHDKWSIRWNKLGNMEIRGFPKYFYKNQGRENEMKNDYSEIFEIYPELPYGTIVEIVNVFDSFDKEKTLL